MKNQPKIQGMNAMDKLRIEILCVLSRVSDMASEQGSEAVTQKIEDAIQEQRKNNPLHDESVEPLVRDLLKFALNSKTFVGNQYDG